MTAKRIQMSRVRPWRADHPDAVVVDRRTRWGNPFGRGTRSGLVREPAVDHPGKRWEYEGRISADGMRHDYHHADGRVIVCHVRHMGATEAVECYRAYVTGGGWPIDWRPRNAPTIDEIRAELAGRDLACWCALEAPCHADVLLELANGLT